jgi:hypothetical protein
LISKSVFLSGACSFSTSSFLDDFFFPSSSVPEPFSFSEDELSDLFDEIYFLCDDEETSKIMEENF